MVIKNLLFIPAYRCQPQISRVLEKIIPFVDYFDEILVIDNRSPDHTAETAAAFIEKHIELRNVKIVRNPVNVNLGGSHKMAFQFAIENGFDHVVILHGDDQGDIKDLEEVLIRARSSRFREFYFGSRFSRNSRLVNYSWFRIFGNRVFNIVASILTGSRINDLGGSGLNLSPVELIKKHSYIRYADDLTFHVFLLLNAIKLRQKAIFIPISWREEDQISNVRMFQQALKLTRILIAFSNRSLLIDLDSNFGSHPREWEHINY